jgi:NitT/TauT family transport system permease protein
MSAPPTDVVSEAQLSSPASIAPAGTKKRRRLRVMGAQVAVLAAFLLCWQFLPEVGFISRSSHLFDSFFISSPKRVAVEIYDLATGTGGIGSIWSYVWPTIEASIFGTIIGLALGGVFGVLLSNFEFLDAVLRPFVVVANAIPRIALIPIFVIVFGLTLRTSVLNAVTVTFFVGFFAAYEGGKTIHRQVVQNAQLLGASNWKILVSVRSPIVIAWLMASLPLAISWAVVTVVTTELLTGFHGMGFLLQTASTEADASLTFAIVVYLAVVALIIVGIAEVLRRRVIHWWGK